MNTATLRKAVDDEFSCYYQADELPHPWTEKVLQTYLPAQAKESASRLRRAVGEEHVAALVQLLSDLREDTNHPLVSCIGHSTGLLWSDDTKDWQVFQRLIELIISFLSTNGSSGPASRADG